MPIPDGGAAQHRGRAAARVGWAILPTLPEPLPFPPPRPYLGDGTRKGQDLAFSGLTDGIARGIEGAGASLGASLFDTTLRLGVTGLSRAGKTVFITALVANLLNRGRMPQLKAEAEGRIQSVYLQPQPDLTLPRPLRTAWAPLIPAKDDPTDLAVAS